MNSEIFKRPAVRLKAFAMSCVAIILAILTTQVLASPAITRGMLADINPVVRSSAAKRLKHAPFYKIALVTQQDRPSHYSASEDVVFRRPGNTKQVLFYLYGNHPDIRKQGGGIRIKLVRVCGKKAAFRLNTANLWIPLGNCGRSNKVRIHIDFTGHLARIHKDRTTLSGELLREAEDMLSGSPSFELAFGAFAFGQGFYNFFGFYPLLASRDPQHGWVPMKPGVLGDAPEPDPGFYDMTLSTPADMTAAIPGSIVAHRMDKGYLVTHVMAAGFRHFSFAFGPFDRVQRRVDGVTVEVYARHGLAGKAVILMDISGRALRFFQRHIYPYPNRRFLVVQTPLSMGVAGLEASGLVYISSMLVESPSGMLGRLFGPGLQQVLPFVVAHETAHEWWAHLVGNSTWQAPFLDEALANEYALYFLQQQQGPEYCTNLCGNILATYALVRSMGSKDAPVSTPASSFGNDIYGYLGVVYAKGGYMMELLRHLLGNREFDRRMHAYAARFAFAKASDKDLQSALAPAGPASRVYKRFVYGKSGDQDICPPGLLYLSTCMSHCMTQCLESPDSFWKHRE